MGTENAGSGGAPEDTLVDDQLPSLVSCVLGQVEGVLPQTLLWDVINRALDQSLAALLRAAGETALADKRARHWRGWSRAQMVPALLAIEQEILARSVAHPPLLKGLTQLIGTLRRYETHDASPREIVTMALSVARLAGTLEAEHQAMLAVCQRPKETDKQLAVLQAALDYEGEEPEPLAIAKLTELADEGIPGALATLGLFWSLGMGMPADGVRGAWLLAEAAALGDVAACHNLSIQYSSGAPGLLPNPTKAELFLQLCRDRGFPM